MQVSKVRCCLGHGYFEMNTDTEFIVRVATQPVVGKEWFAIVSKATRVQISKYFPSLEELKKAIGI